MAKHEFGIMMDAPQPGKRYDEYEPWKYDCISVDDDYVEGIAEKLGFIDFYWHTLSIKEKGDRKSTRLNSSHSSQSRMPSSA